MIMEQYKYVIKLNAAITKFDYDRVKELITYYRDNAKEYFENYDSWIYCIINTKSPLMIDILKIIFDYCSTSTTHSIFEHINERLLKWSINTSNLDIVKYMLSVYKKFNIKPHITELLNDDNDEFFDITDEILYYFVKKRKEYGVMKISKYYGYYYTINRLANMGVETTNNILI